MKELNCTPLQAQKLIEQGVRRVLVDVFLSRLISLNIEKQTMWYKVRKHYYTKSFARNQFSVLVPNNIVCVEDLLK